MRIASRLCLIEGRKWLETRMDIPVANAAIGSAELSGSFVILKRCPQCKEQPVLFLPNQEKRWHWIVIRKTRASDVLKSLSFSWNPSIEVLSHCSHVKYVYRCGIVMLPEKSNELYDSLHSFTRMKILSLTFCHCTSQTIYCQALVRGKGTCTFSSISSIF